jgi:ribosome-associated translation inhibitor RaiA
MGSHLTVRTAGVPVTVHGDVTPEAAAEVERRIAALAEYTSEPILYARVRITRVADPATPRPVIAQGNLDVNGRIARAQVAAGTLREALDLLQARLRQRLRRLARHWQARRGQVSRLAGTERLPGGRPHADRPVFRSRPSRQRQVVQHKTYAPTLSTADEAASDMELLDYDFYLFTDATTGQDAVIYRAPPTGYRLAAVTPPPASSPQPAVPLTVSRQPAPRLDLSAAVERLNNSGTPFLFFAAGATGRGQVLYRRYDGHYGLITPADGG